eukprot:TRINITY_DN45749_c0_g1_i2.p1 TRINITY_DN45749_c0_g1~~TRINITY_DN45749_c0_g1_i2.p1  ORF type:complete len:121 (-),score=8.05 TRINITY_DN45749_c0_g1_i2:385-747(-)
MRETERERGLCIWRVFPCSFSGIHHPSFRALSVFFLLLFFCKSTGPKSNNMDHLPKYDPHSHVAKRKTSRLKAALNSVHIIPVIVVLCSIILWFFSDSRPIREQHAMDGKVDMSMIMEFY